MWHTRDRHQRRRPMCRVTQQCSLHFILVIRLGAYLHLGFKQYLFGGHDDEVVPGLDGYFAYERLQLAILIGLTRAYDPGADGYLCN